MSTRNDTTLFGVPSKGPLKLTTGAPGTEFLHDVSRIISQATQTLLTGEHGLGGDSSALQYGPRLGSPLFHETLAKFLTEFYGEEVNNHCIVPTAGATHGLHLVASLFFRQNDVIFVEDPTYFIALNILRDDFGMKIVPIDCDEGGMVISDLKKKVKEHVTKTDISEKKPFRAMVYVIPTFHNPTSRIMPKDR